MENHQNMESFEKFIQQQSDEFKMYPSKKVWYSIYNNFHPSRKWPSISMCIVLLSALLMIGYLNTKTNKVTIENSSIAKSDNKPLINHLENFKPINTLSYQYTEKTDQQNNTASTAKFVDKSNIIFSPKKNSTVVKEANSLLPNEKLLIVNNIKNTVATHKKSVKSITPSTNITANYEAIAVVESEALVSNTVEIKAISPTQNIELTENTNTAILQKIYTDQQKNNAGPNVIAINIADESFLNEHLINAATLSQIPIATNVTDKQWIENYAFYNRQTPKKWKGKLAWQAHFTPSVIYRNLHNNTIGKNIGSNALATALNNTSINSVVNQTPSLGLEAGIGLQFPIFNGIKVSAGIQLNYTRYNIGAFGNAHPSATSLVMNNESTGQVYELSKSTPYSNIIGLNPQTLHNQTYQLSLPIGTSIKLAGIDNVEWYAGATIQPTIVFAGSSYLISTDRRNYVKENNMLNHFNMNAGFETYISFKTVAGLTWQIGPQFRKQLFSTNSKQFSIEERIISYGLKIGVSKKL